MPQYSNISDSQSSYQPILERQIAIILHQPNRTDAIQTDAIAPDPSPHPSWFGKLWKAIKQAFEQSNEPTFWQIGDRDGNFYWEGYDPVSNRSIHCASEDEARIWLEQLSPFDKCKLNKGKNISHVISFRFSGRIRC